VEKIDKKKRGLTLIELLPVVAIIAILIALLVPSVCHTPDSCDHLDPKPNHVPPILPPYAETCGIPFPSEEHQESLILPHVQYNCRDEPPLSDFLKCCSTEIASPADPASILGKNRLRGVD